MKMANCNCIAEVNAKLAEHNGKLSIGFAITKDLGVVGRLLLGVEKHDKANRKKPPLVSAVFCPFCGGKFDADALKPAAPAAPAALDDDTSIETSDADARPAPNGAIA